MHLFALMDVPRRIAQERVPTTPATPDLFTSLNTKLWDLELCVRVLLLVNSAFCALFRTGKGWSLRLRRIGAGMQQLPYCIPASSLNAG